MVTVNLQLLQGRVKQGVNKDGVNSGVNTKTRCGHWCGQQNDSAKHYSAVNYAAKTGFLVRKEMVRSEVRSESMKMDRGGDDNFRQSLDETAP